MSKTAKILLVLILLATIAATISYTVIIPRHNAKMLEIALANCTHEHYLNGICTFCGHVCEHSRWRHGFCQECGIECEHEWVSGRCEICGLLCDHEKFVDGVCARCGYECKHTRYENGACVRCGKICKHNFTNGVCLVCKMKCDHKDHDQVTQVCFTCGMQVVHKYKNGVCSCGKVFEPAVNWPDESLYKPCSTPGTIESVTYSTESYDGSFQGVIEKNMSIYVPYNYNPNNKYDVLILYHGGFDDEKAWTTNWRAVDGREVVMRNLYDNMIAQKLCSPLIIVSPATGTWTNNYELTDVTIDQNTGELRSNILPYIVQHYSTYAEGDTLEDIEKAREHFAIGGCSNGSLFAYNCGMLANFQYFGNYICISGDNCSQEISEEINKGEWAKLPIYCYCAAAGETDGQRDRVRNGFNLITESAPERLSVDKNAYFTLIKGSHDWKTFSIAVYNALQVMFPNTPVK